MRAGPLIGIILIVVGVVALAFQGITYTTHKKVFQLGNVQATREEHKTVPLPPVLGGLALAGGIVLLIATKREA